MTSPTLEQLKRDLGQLTAALGELRDQSPDLEITDETGQVTVRLDQRGRLASVQLANRWKESIQPSVLGATILSLPAQAALRRVSGALDRAKQAPAPAVEVPATRYEFPASVGSDLDALIVGLAKKTESYRAQPVDERYEDSPASPEGEPLRSENGRVEAVLEHGAIIELRIDEHWLGRVATQAVSDSITEVLVMANQVLDEAPAASTGGRRLSPAGQEIRRELNELNDTLAAYRRQG